MGTDTDLVVGTDLAFKSGQNTYTRMGAELMFNITIPIATAEELQAVLPLLNQILPGKPEVAPVVKQETTTQAPVETTEPEPVAEPEKPQTSKVTMETVRAKLASLMREGKQTQVKEIFASFGVDKLSEIPAEKYGEVMAAAEAI